MLVRQLQRSSAQQQARLGFAAVCDGQALAVGVRCHQELRWGPRKHLRSPTPACCAISSNPQPLLASLGITASTAILPSFLGARRKSRCSPKASERPDINKLGCTCCAHPHNSCAQALSITHHRRSQVHASKVAAGDRRTAVFFVRPRDRSARDSVYSTVATHSPASASSPVGKP